MQIGAIDVVAAPRVCWRVNQGCDRSDRSNSSPWLLHFGNPLNVRRHCNVGGEKESQICRVDVVIAAFSEMRTRCGVMQSCVVRKQTRRKMVAHTIVGLDPNATSRL